MDSERVFPFLFITNVTTVLEGRHSHKVIDRFRLFEQRNFQKLFLSSAKQYIKPCVNLKHAFTFPKPRSVGCSDQ